VGLHGEAKLATAAGPVEICKLVDRTVLNPGFSEVIFIWDGTRVFVSEASEFRSIGQQQLFEIVLDDGEILSVSASSALVTSSGDRKLPPELKMGDSLLPLYIESDNYGYPTYRIPGKAAKRKISRLMAEWILGHELGRGTVVEHIDGNRKNYHPDNLKITVNEDRAVKSHRHSVVKAIDQAKKLLDQCAVASPKMAKIVKPRRKTNHKVVSVTPGRLGEVYIASVRSGYSISVSGVFLDLPS
jgi:hypothetical protein